MEGIPVAVELTNMETGEKKKLDSYMAACEFLGRSSTYLKTKVAEVDEVDVSNVHGIPYHLVKIGPGKRKDSPVTPRPRKVLKNVPLEQRQKFQCQLCTTCARASGFCSWSSNLTPVEGWDAEPTKLKHQVGRGPKNTDATIMESFRIKDCPLYIQDADTKEGRRIQRNMLLEERRQRHELQGSDRDAEEDV